MNLISGSLVGNGGSSITFDEGNMQVSLSPVTCERLSEFKGQSVTMGIRPEDIHDPETVGPGVATAEIEARVEVVEPMGNEVFLFLTTGKTSFVARVDPLHMPEVDQEVKLAVEVDKAHFFAEDTLESLLKR